MVAIVLFGALLHAGWNALIRSGADKSLDTALIHSLGVLVALPVVLAVGLVPRSVHNAHAGKALRRFAFANAGIIAVYTVVDGLGVRASGNPAVYVAALFLFDGIPYALIVLWRRRREGDAVWAYVAGRWKVALMGSLASVVSYAIALSAMMRAPVAVVAALRETSVLFAAGIGALSLKESFGVLRALGTLLIVAGVVALRFA